MVNFSYWLSPCILYETYKIVDRNSCRIVYCHIVKLFKNQKHISKISFFFCPKRIHNWKKKGHTICSPHLVVLFLCFETIRLFFFFFFFTNTNSILLPECWPGRSRLNLNSFCYRSSGCLVDFSRKYRGMYYYKFE